MKDKVTRKISKKKLRMKHKMKKNFKSKKRSLKKLSRSRRPSSYFGEKIINKTDNLDDIDWNLARFSLHPISSPIVNIKKSPSRLTDPMKQRSSSPDWTTSRFMIATIAKKKPTTPIKNKNTSNSKYDVKYTLSQKTLDKLLSKPEVHLYDVVKYGPRAKDDFLYGLHLMRREILNKIDLLKYKKKLRNNGNDLLRNIQQNTVLENNSNLVETAPTKPINEHVIDVLIDEEMDSSDESVNEPTASFEKHTKNENFNRTFHEEILEMEVKKNIENRNTNTSFAKKKSNLNNILNTFNVNKNKNGSRKSKNVKKNILKVKWPLPRRCLLDIRK